MAAYATSTDLVARFDDRILKDLATDTGTAETDLSTNARITAMLLDASGIVDANCLVGKRYTTTELEALAGNALGLLKRITCGLAVDMLTNVRGIGGSEELKGFASEAAFAKEALQQLRDGVLIFGELDAQQEAGQPKVSGPTTADLRNSNIITQRALSRYYPRQRLPNNR